MSERHYRYTLILDPDPEEGGYTVTVPALPGVVTQGETMEEAIAMGREAIRCHIEGLLADGETVPEEGEPPHIVTVDISP
ncbi:MAG TPA: type II toxin-antitoxin system HicB family antitoxin [Polyangia bacterium]|jgi:predicted RNase H-like HicB family nuclease|nr:type II toxin-antitoxin system HicB family antitoxin [Polyangia bacterium]